MSAVRDVPISAAAWTSVVDGRKSDVFHSPAWMRVLERTYGFEMRALVIEDGDTAAGVPFAIVDDFRGHRAVCVPFSDFCDPLIDGVEQWDALSNALLQRSSDVRLRVLHAVPPLEDDRFEKVGRARWHLMEWDSDRDAAWAGIHSSARRAIRKARSQSVLVRKAESEEDLRAFFELHLRTRKAKYRLLAQPYRFFQCIWEEFVEEGTGSLFVATHDDRVIAGVLFLDWHGTRYYKFNASDPDTVGVRPNDLIIWSAVEDAMDSGIASVDFGLSDWDQEGLVRYKRKYATHEGEISFLRARGAPAPKPDVASALTTITDLFTNATVPDTVTESAGASLYRYFA